MTHHRLLSLAVTLVLGSLARAGDLTILNLSSQNPLECVVTNGQLKQPLALAPGEDSGTFSLPAHKTIISVKQAKIAPLTLAHQSSARAILCYQDCEKLRWHTFVSRASDQTTTLRAINLTSQEVTLQRGKSTITIPAGEEKSFGEKPTARLSLRLIDGDQQTASSESATAWAVFVFPTTEGPALKIWADR
jgi:hypothetical protein